MCAAIPLFHANLRAEQPSPPMVDYSRIDLRELGIEPFTPTTDAKTGFVTGGRNATELLLKLTAIQGRLIADLERDMRPNAASDVGSTSGFLGPDESLLEVLAADNRLVVDEHRLTHQELARHLRILAELGNRNRGEEFSYRGQRFKVTLMTWRGYQLSPFRDGTRTNQDAVVENVTNGEKLKYSLLVPLMIERYGFYEGKGTPYRVEPAQVLRVLALAAKAEE